MNLVSIAAITLAFGLIVFFHEAGHFFAARLSGMAVHEFSFGIGRPLLFWLKRGETQYSFRLWPFFSYVRVAGMEPGDEHPRGFSKKSRLAQAFVLVMGCMMNFVLAVGIYIVMGTVVGLPVPEPRVREVMPDTPAARAGLLPGDELLGVGSKTGLSVDEIREAIQKHPGKPLDLEIEREGEAKTISITPMVEEAYELKGLRIEKVPIGLIGIRFDFTRKQAGVGESIVLGFRETIAIIQLQAAGLVGMFTRQVPADVMGPVGVVHTMYGEARSGWAEFLSMFAMIAIAIGFVNLLPIPALDGSRLVIVALEAIRRKPFDKQKESMVHLVGFGLLLALVVVLTYKDILRIVTGGE
ncbi:MAG: M50 family metallopeptidase [Armatimonadota bacterium]|nr:M50 family metallopeptidase [Armatimonadota bacterium]